MKGKRLTDYIDALRKAGVEDKDYFKAKRFGELALKKLDKLSYTQRDLFGLYYMLGEVYATLHEYSKSIDNYYKAYLLGLKEHFSPTEIAYLSVGMASSFIMTQHIEQALSQLQKIQDYFKQYGDQIEPMNKRQYFFALINLAYCYLHKQDLDKAGGIINGELKSNMAALAEYKLCHMDYHHLRGEYLVERGEYQKARQAFEESIRVSREANFLVGELESQLHVAMLLLLDNGAKDAPASERDSHDAEFTPRQRGRQNLDEAVGLFLSIYDRAKGLRENALMCEAGLLLSKCYSLRNQPDKSVAIENRIKPLLKNLDISWFYEKTREFDGFHKLIQPIYKSPGYTPVVLTNGVDKHYEKSSYKDILIGKSPAIQKVYQLIEKIAGTDLPVLVQGETGTGKELICRFLHQRSLRAEKPYLTIDCGALPENLLENELFGHIAGAYTGATEDKKGYVELASGGTLMLDEITNMSAGMQRKLLRVLEEKQIWPLGAEKSVPVDTRFVFASNQNVEQMMAKGLLRSDLFYRINVVIINLPPLRERREDIPLLIEHFLGKYQQVKMKGEMPDAPRFTPDALRVLSDYHWSGNVRELENEIQRICVLHRDEKIISKDMLSEHISDRPPSGRDLASAGASEQINTFKPQITQSTQIRSGAGRGKTLIELRDEFEREIINQTIKEHKGNIAGASRQLGYDRPSLYRKMKQLGIK